MTRVAENLQRHSSAIRRPQWTTIVVLLIAGLVGVAAYAVHGRFYVGDDFEVYHATGSVVRQGDSPYDFSLPRAFRFIYPPFAAVLLTPLSLLGKDGALGLWTALSVLALAGIAASALRAAGVASPRRRAVLTVVTTIAGLLLTPVLLNLWLGQINLVIAWLVLADLGRRTGRLRGAGLGIAAGIKLTPLIFILYLVLTRQRRAAGVAAASFLATVGAGFLVLPKASWQYWSGAFLDTSRALPDGADLTWDHSLRGLVARYTSADLELWSWLVLAVVVGVWGLMVARRASRHGNELAGLAVCAVTGLLVSPLSWAPHWVWCVPLLVLAGTLGSPAGRGLRTLGLWLAFHVQTYYFVLPFVFGTWPPIRLPSQVFTHLAVLTGLTVIAAVGYKSKLGVDTAAGGRDDLS